MSVLKSAPVRQRLVAGIAAAILTFAAIPAAAQQQTREDTAPSVEQICLTNACADPAKSVVAPPAPAPTVLTGPPPNAPPNSFVAKFNGNSPRLLRGRVVGIDWGAPHSYLRVAADDGQLYRVEGGSVENLPDHLRAGMEGAIGKDVVVRGYDAWEPACDQGCLVNGRDVRLADGSPLAGSAGAAPATAPAARR